MKKFNELTPADFPGYDPIKISEWLAATEEGKSNTSTFWVVILIICVILSIAFGGVIAPGFLFLIFVPMFFMRKARKLEKELKMNSKIVMMARQGQLIDL